MLGFPSYLATPGQDPFAPTVLLDSVYRSLQLFVLSWEWSSRPIPWILQVARLLAACVALSAALAALFQLFRERVASFLLQRSREHVILCGLGERGVALVEDLCEQRQKVVVIEGQENHPDLLACRALGAKVLVGSPADPRVLSQARVDRAATLLSLFQDDARSIETLTQVYRLSSGRSLGHLRCVVQIFDHEMRRLLDKHEAFKDQRIPVNLELFNLFDTCAHVMLRESPALFRQGEPRRLLIVGMGWLGQMLLQRVVRAWHIDRLAKLQDQASGRPQPAGLGWKLNSLQLLVVDRDRLNLETHLAGQGLSQSEDCEVFANGMDVEGDDFLAGKFVPQHDTGNTIDAVFICLPDDRLALLTAVRLRERFGANLPVVVRMSSRSGAADLLTTPGMEGLHVVGLHDLVSTMSLVTNATIEMIAREIHRDYVLDQFAHGQTAESNSVLRPWHMLDPGLQESNRQAAGHIDAKLKAIGCEKFPVRAVESLFEFTPDEVERLARMEHERWCEERRQMSWTFGPVKDVHKKTSPALVSYDTLPDATNEANRTAIRRIPVWLAKAGFGIRRVKEKAGN
jgi:hypothetical protein